MESKETTIVSQDEFNHLFRANDVAVALLGYKKDQSPVYRDFYKSLEYTEFVSDSKGSTIFYNAVGHEPREYSVGYQTESGKTLDITYVGFVDPKTGQNLLTKEGTPLMLLKGAWELRRRSAHHAIRLDSKRHIVPRFNKDGRVSSNSVIAIQTSNQYV